ncbi:unnamed protein product [Vicia faba]|uniref:GAGA-binding transcriptional activator n=1 Tax=Vicia faba TaxID=3906 RepID=A0AAV1AVC7_VICFA|nr:unnamed protein product [Vicia faba]
MIQLLSETFKDTRITIFIFYLLHHRLCEQQRCHRARQHHCCVISHFRSTKTAISRSNFLQQQPSPSTTNALPESPIPSEVGKPPRRAKRPKESKSVSPNKKTPKTSRKVKKEGEDLNKTMFANDKALEWKNSQEIINESDDLKKQLVVSKADWKPQDLALNQVAYDDSTMPAPVCSCTGVLRQCYKWGNGGWQSACCTTTLSVREPTTTTHKWNRSPSRKRPVVADANVSGGNERRIKSPARRPSPSPEKKMKNGSRLVRGRESGFVANRKVNAGPTGVRRDSDEGSGRRSRSPSCSRTVGVSSKIGVGVGQKQAPAKKSESEEGEEKNDIVSQVESIENPHVSMECFIFL